MDKTGTFERAITGDWRTGAQDASPESAITSGWSGASAVVLTKSGE